MVDKDIFDYLSIWFYVIIVFDRCSAGHRRARSLNNLLYLLQGLGIKAWKTFKDILEWKTNMKVKFGLEYFDDKGNDFELFI